LACAFTGLATLLTDTSSTVSTGLLSTSSAAGALIAQEAGAVITDFSNRPFDIYEKEVLATNGKIHKAMLSLLELEDII